MRGGERERTRRERGERERRCVAPKKKHLSKFVHYFTMTTAQFFSSKKSEKTGHLAKNAKKVTESKHS